MEILDDCYTIPIEQGDLDALRCILEETGDLPLIAEELLCWAAMEKRLPIVEWLLSQGVDPNRAFPHDDGCPVLYWAAFAKRMDLVRALVEGGATVLTDTPPEDGCTALHVAAEKGDVEMVTYLLDEAEGAAAFHIFDYCDFTPLHCAIRGEKLDAAKLLLERGADPNALVHVHHDARIGDPPLREAVRSGQVEITKLLLNYGGDPDRPGWMWHTARFDVEELEEPVRTEMERLLEVPPLKKLKESAHKNEVVRQLTEDLTYHGFGELSLSWRGSKAIGETVQVRGEPLCSFENIRLCDKSGEVVGRGRFGFLVLTVEIDFRVFWTHLRVGDEVLEEGNGGIPAHIWAGLSSDQRSWLVMDSRNHRWRDQASGNIIVEGVPVR